MAMYEDKKKLRAAGRGARELHRRFDSKTDQKIASDVVKATLKNSSAPASVRELAFYARNLENEVKYLRALINDLENCPLSVREPSVR